MKTDQLDKIIDHLRETFPNADKLVEERLALYEKPVSEWTEDEKHDFGKMTDADKKALSNDFRAVLKRIRERA